MTEIDSFEAGTHFNDLLQRVTHRKEKFVVTLEGKPVAMLGPVRIDRPEVEGLTALLDELRAFRASIAARGPTLAPSESWKEFAREGLA